MGGIPGLWERHLLGSPEENGNFCFFYGGKREFICFFLWKMGISGIFS